MRINTGRQRRFTLRLNFSTPDHPVIHVKTASTPASTSTPATHALNCPECGASNELSDAQLIDGTELRCQHCPASLVVTQEWDEHLDQHYWRLESARDAEFDEPA